MPTYQRRHDYRYRWHSLITIHCQLRVILRSYLIELQRITRSWQCKQFYTNRTTLVYYVSIRIRSMLEERAIGCYLRVFYQGSKAAAAHSALFTNRYENGQRCARDEYMTTELVSTDATRFSASVLVFVGHWHVKMCK